MWVPRDLNVRADFLSHAAEYPDHGYSLHQALFQMLDEEWGPHTVDRFATASNRLLPLFCSRFFHPEAMWTDSLSVSWAGEVNWVFPPVELASPAISHLRRCPTQLGPWCSTLSLARLPFTSCVQAAIFGPQTSLG